MAKKFYLDIDLVGNQLLKARAQNSSGAPYAAAPETEGAFYFDTVAHSFMVSSQNSWVGVGAYTHPNHTGDVTSVADGVTTIGALKVTTGKLDDGAVTTLKIGDDQVTYAKIQNVAALRLVGNLGGSAGDMLEYDNTAVRTWLKMDENASNTSLATSVSTSTVLSIIDSNAVGNAALPLVRADSTHAGIISGAEYDLIHSAIQSNVDPTVDFADGSKTATSQTLSILPGGDTAILGLVDTANSWAGLMAPSDKLRLNAITDALYKNKVGAIAYTQPGDGSLTETYSEGGSTVTTAQVPVATTSNDGVMSWEDKVLLDSVDDYKSHLKLTGGVSATQININLMTDESGSDVAVGAGLWLDGATHTEAGGLTAADKTKLDGIANNANYVDETLYTPLAGQGANKWVPAGVEWATGVILEANNTDDGKLPTVLAVENYVNTKVGSMGAFQGGYDAVNDLTDGTPAQNLDSSGGPDAGAIVAGDYFLVSVAGTFFTTAVLVGDSLIAKNDDPMLEADWTIIASPPASHATESVWGETKYATKALAESKTENTLAITPKHLHEQLDVLPHKMSFTVGDGTATTFNLAHGLYLGTASGQVANHDFTISIFDTILHTQVDAEVTAIDHINVSVHFSVAPTNNQFRVTIIG